MEELGRKYLYASLIKDLRQCEFVTDTGGDIMRDIWKWFIIKPDFGNFKVQVFRSPVAVQWQKRL